MYFSAEYTLYIPRIVKHQETPPHEIRKSHPILSPNRTKTMPHNLAVFPCLTVAYTSKTCPTATIEITVSYFIYLQYPQTNTQLPTIPSRRFPIHDPPHHFRSFGKCLIPFIRVSGTFIHSFIEYKSVTIFIPR